MCLDAGYVNPAICREIILNGHTPLMPYKSPMTSKEFFKKYEYAYDEYYDCYICPNNEVLSYSTTDKNGYKQYKSNPDKCANCPLKDQCTKSKNHQKIILRQKGMKNNLKMARNRAKQKLVVQFFFWSMAVEVTNAINFFEKICVLGESFFDFLYLYKWRVF